MRDIEFFFYGFFLAATLCVLIAWLFLQNITQQWRMSQKELDHLKEKLESKEDEHLEISDRHDLFQKILDASPSVIYVKNLKGQMMLANWKFLSVLDGSKDQIMGKTDFEFLPPLVAKRMRDMDNKVIETGRTAYYEESVPLPTDTKEHIFLSVKFPLKDKLGRIFAVGGISTDVTDLKEMEERLNLALSAGGMGTFYWEASHGEGKCTEQTRSLHGMSADEVFSFNLMKKCVHPEDQEAFVKVIEESLQQGKDFSLEYRVGTGDKERWLAIRARSFGRPTQLLGVCWDISAFKEAEQKLKQNYEAREDFLKVISHEIKTPLSSLMLKTQMTRRSLDKGDPTVVSQEKFQSFLASTEVQMDRLVKSVEKLLN